MNKQEWMCYYLVKGTNERATITSTDCTREEALQAAHVWCNAGGHTFVSLVPCVTVEVAQPDRESHLHVEAEFAASLGMTVEQVLDTDIRTLVNRAYDLGIELDIKMLNGKREPGLHCIVEPLDPLEETTHVQQQQLGFASFES